jgi:hypothetical protein
LKEFAVGCHIGTSFLGSLADVDDVVLLAPTPRAMRKLLQKCDEYAEDFSVMYLTLASPNELKILVKLMRMLFQKVAPVPFGENSIDYVDKCMGSFRSYFKCRSQLR